MALNGITNEIKFYRLVAQNKCAQPLNRHRTNNSCTPSIGHTIRCKIKADSLKNFGLVVWMHA